MSFMIVPDRRLADILHRLFRLHLRIRLVLLNRVQVSVELMNILNRQVLPPPSWPLDQRHRHL